MNQCTFCSPKERKKKMNVFFSKTRVLFWFISNPWKYTQLDAEKSDSKCCSFFWLRLRGLLKPLLSPPPLTPLPSLSGIYACTLYKLQKYRANFDPQYFHLFRVYKEYHQHSLKLINRPLLCKFWVFQFNLYMGWQRSLL